MTGPTRIATAAKALISVSPVLGACALFAAGVAVALANPLLILGIVVAAGVTWLSFRQPVWVLWAAVLALMVIPTYIRFPVVPGLPPLTVSLALLVVLVAVLLLKALLGERNLPCGPMGHRLIAAFMLFGAVLLLSLTDPRTATDSVDFWIKLVVVPWLLGYAMLRLARDPAGLDRLFKIVTAGALVAVAYAIGELLSGTNILQDMFLHGEDRLQFAKGEDFLRVGIPHQAYSLVTNPIEFGALMSMVLFYPLLRASYARARLAQIAWGAAALAIVIGVLLSFSRGPLVTAAVTTVALSWIVKPARKLVLVSALTAVLSLVAAWPFIGDKVQNRLTNVENVTLRFTLFTIAWKMALDHPLLGVGIGNFPEYQTETIREHRINTIAEPHADRVHTSENLYLQLAAETGFLGLTAFLLLLAAYFALTVRVYRNALPGDVRILTLASVMAVVAYLLNGFTVASLQHYVITLVAGFAFVAPMLLEKPLPATT